MRTMLWTVFLVVALQGMAAASTAFASPTDLRSSVRTERVLPSSPPSRLEADAPTAQPAANAERNPIETQPQVLSKNFSSPKPVQIYWFFGGR